MVNEVAAVGLYPGEPSFSESAGQQRGLLNL